MLMYIRMTLVILSLLIKMSAQLTTYDFTVSQGSPWDTHTKIISHLKEWCKKFVFQLERSDTGYVHYQGRVSLIKKRRMSELVNKFLPGSHLSPTCASVHQTQSFNYVMKADTRLEGPWSDKDIEEERPPLTRQLRHFMSLPLYPWQAQVRDMVQVVDDRSIKLIFDRRGNNGKSILAEFLEYNGLAWEMPPFRCMEDIMQCCMSVKAQRAYLIDMPRGMKKDKLGEFYSGLECLKNGVCYDKRYSFKKRRMDRPQIVVFTNKLPQFELLVG